MGKKHKKREFCPGVRLGQSMLDNRFLKSLQKTTKNHTEKQKFSHFITKMYPYFRKMSNNIAIFDHKMGVYKGFFAF